MLTTVCDWMCSECSFSDDQANELAAELLSKGVKTVKTLKTFYEVDTNIIDQLCSPTITTAMRDVLRLKILQLDRKPLEALSVKDVSNLFSMLYKGEKYGDFMLINRVSGSDLEKISNIDDLDVLCINSAIHRQTIWKNIVDWRRYGVPNSYLEVNVCSDVEQGNNAMNMSDTAIGNSSSFPIPIRNQAVYSSSVDASSGGLASSDYAGRNGTVRSQRLRNKANRHSRDVSDIEVVGPRKRRLRSSLNSTSEKKHRNNKRVTVSESSSDSNVRKECKAFLGNDEKKQLEAISYFCRIISKKNFSVDLLFELGVVARAIYILQRGSDYSLTLVKKCLILLNSIIVHNDSECAIRVIQMGAIDASADLCFDNRETVRINALWLVGNAGIDNKSDMKELVLQEGVAKRIAESYQTVEQVKLPANNNSLRFLLRYYAETIFRLCSTSTVTQFEKLRDFIPVLVDLIEIEDAQVLNHAALAIRHLTHTDQRDQLDTLLFSGILKTFWTYLKSSKSSYCLQHNALLVLNKFAHSCNAKQAHGIIEDDNFANRLIALVTKQQHNIAIREKALLFIGNLCLHNPFDRHGNRQKIVHFFINSDELMQSVSSIMGTDGKDAHSVNSDNEESQLVQPAQNFIANVVLGAADWMLTRVASDYHIYPMLFDTLEDCAELHKEDGNTNEINDHQNTIDFMLMTLKALKRMITCVEASKILQCQKVAEQVLAEYDAEQSWSSVKALQDIGDTRITLAVHDLVIAAETKNLISELQSSP